MPNNIYLRQSVMVQVLMHTCRVFKSFFAQYWGEYGPTLLQNCNEISEPANSLLKIHLRLSVQLHSGEILSIVVENGQNFTSSAWSCLRSLYLVPIRKHTGWICSLEKHKCSCLIVKIEAQEKEKVVVLHHCVFLGILAIGSVWPPVHLPYIC